MPQFSYTPKAGTAGMLYSTGGHDIDVLTVEIPKQKDEVPIAGTTDGNYWIQIQGEEGTFTIKFAAVAQTAIQIADGLAANAAAQVALRNIVSLDATVGTPVKLDFIHPGKAYAVTFSSNPGGNMSLSPVQSPIGSPIGLGIAVGSDDGRLARPLKIGDTAAQIYGTSVRNADLELPLEVVQGVPGYPPGYDVSLCPRGEVWVPTEGPVAVNDPVFARIDAGVGQVFGAYGNTADGGKAVQLSGKWRTATTGAGQLARMRLNTP